MDLRKCHTNAAGSVGKTNVSSEGTDRGKKTRTEATAMMAL